MIEHSCPAAGAEAAPAALGTALLVGAHGDVVMADCGRLALDADEQVTLTTEASAEYVAHKTGVLRPRR